MSVNENNSTNTIKNQEAYEGIREAMLQKGVIPKEVIKYSEAMQEKKRLQEKNKSFGDSFSITANTIEAIDKQYPALSPILTHTKVIVKKAGLPFEIIDLILEYQINGDKGIIIKISGKIIETIIFGVGVNIALEISTVVASYCASMGVATAIFGFVVFAGIVGLTIWISNQSEVLLRFIYENIYIRLKKEKDRYLNFIDYIFSGQWCEDLQNQIAKEIKNKIKKEAYNIIENPIGRFILK